MTIATATSLPTAPAAVEFALLQSWLASGMRWTEQMAEAIVQLRAIYLSQDFDQYWQSHIEQDQRRLYPAFGASFQSSHTP